MQFDFRIQVFHAVAEKLSFTKAAEILFISQPAVTKHISELESQIGLALFIRKGNKIALTQAGEIFYSYSQKIKACYRELETELTDLQEKANGTLNIGASTTIAQYILPKIIAQFKRQNPQVNILLLNGNSEDIEAKLVENKIDVGLVEGNAHSANIQYQPFVKDEIILATSVKNKQLQQDEINLTQLKNIPLLIRETGSGTLDVIDEALNAIHLNRNDLTIEIQLGNSESIKEYLMHSNTAALISIHAINKELKNNELRIIEIKGLKIDRTFQFIQLQGQRSNLVEKFKQFCIRQYNL
jgi:DNA-binding transcriptional LysR family regulator